MNNDRQFGWGLPLLASLLLWVGLIGAALAQQSVLPGYQICSTASGSTQCSFQPVDATHPLPTTGGGGGGGAATIADGADVAEGSTVDAPAIVPTSVSSATTIALLKALNNSLNASLPLPTGAATSANQINGNQQVQGNVASGAADSGNPVKVGGVFNTTPPTLLTGQRGDLQLVNNGSLKISSQNGTVASAGDGVTATNNTVNVIDSAGSGRTGYTVFPLAFNGTTLDRVRTIVGAIGAGTGTAAMAVAPTSAASAANTITNATSAALEVARAAKASAGNLYGYYCTAIAGAAGGFCLGYNATACPANGAAVTAALVLDVCAFDTTNKGCSISRIPGPARNYSAGISVCMTTATSPFATMVSNVDTGFISVDYQ